MKLEFHPLSVSDLNDAVIYYDSKRNGLGSDLRSEIYESIESIEHNPRRFRVVKGEIRRCFVHRFPYSVLFKIVDSETIRILVIRHHRQKSTYGFRRT